MYLIQRRILTKIVTQTLLVFAFVGVIVTTTQVLNQVFRLIDASSNLMVALKMFAYLIPTISVSVLPLAFLIACVNTYDQMDEAKESVILLGTGAHPATSLVPAGLIAVLLSGLVLVLSLFVEPTSNRVVRETIDGLRFDALKIIAGNGVLREVQRDLYIRGGGYRDDGLIDGLFILDRRNPAEETSYVAQTGEFVERDGRVYLLLYNGNIQVRDRTDSSVHRVNFRTYEAEPTSILDDPDSGGRLQPRQTSTAALQEMLNGETQTRFTTSAMRKELVRRYTDWLYPLVFFSVCAFLVLRQVPGRETSRWRLPIAVLVGFLIKATGLTILGSAGSGGFAATASFLLPSMAAALLLALALVKATRGHFSLRPPGRPPVPARA